ncbi:MAG: 3-oxoacyl-[acyl-carrier protein] reductase, partial [uncultured Nocardioides sp.]
GSLRRSRRSHHRSRTRHRIRYGAALRQRGRVGRDRRPRRGGGDRGGHADRAHRRGEGDRRRLRRVRLHRRGGDDPARGRRARRDPHPGQQRRDHPRQPAVQDDRGRLGPGDGGAPQGPVQHDQGRPEALRGAALRQDPQPLERLRPRQPGPGQLLGRQDGRPGLHPHPGHRARPVRHQCQRHRAGVHRHRDDRRDGRADRNERGGLPGRCCGVQPGSPGGLPRGHRRCRSVPVQRRGLLHHRSDVVRRWRGQARL